MNKPFLIDAHAHLNFTAFDQDRSEVIDRALEAGTWLINVGTQQDTSRKAVEIADNYDEGVYAIVGLHPVHTSKSFHDVAELGEGGKEFTSTGEKFDLGFYRQLLTNPKVVGIGECGLDYYRLEQDSVLRQKQNFEAQISLAKEFNKPLMLHIRPGKNTPSPYLEALAMIKQGFKEATGNVHFFAGTLEEAKAFLDFGFSISFTGVITFATEYQKLVEYVPLDRLLIETDCPYVTPKPFRGQRNEPVYVAKVAEMVAKWKSLSLAEVAVATTQNSRKLFNI